MVIENLSKLFKGPRGGGVLAVNGINLSVEDKELLVLVGPSGCGKSTTLRLIAGLDEITSGTISIDGRVVNGVPPKDRDIAMVFQHYALYPHMTVYENLAFGLKLRKYGRPETDRRVRDAADLLSLKDCLDSRPGELSGGQRQRVAVGRALVRRPKVFLFDEPFSNLDAGMRVRLRRELSQLHARLAATMIYVTHDQGEAMTLGDRIAVMKEGAMQQVAQPLELYRRPANLFVAGFIGSPPMNIFHGAPAQRNGGLFFQAAAAPEGGAAGFAVRVENEMAGRLRDYGSRKIVLGLRPEHIAVNLRPPEDLGAQTVEAEVVLVEPMGAETHLYSRTGAHDFAARAPAGCPAEARQKVSFIFDMAQARLFDPETEKAIV